jgi:hypothetical protein
MHRDEKTVSAVKNAVSWDVTPCGSCSYRRFEGTHDLHRQGGKKDRAKNNISISLILSTLMMEATRSYETSVPTRATWRHIQRRRHSS